MNEGRLIPAEEIISGLRTNYFEDEERLVVFEKLGVDPAAFERHWLGHLVTFFKREDPSIWFELPSELRGALIDLVEYPEESSMMRKLLEVDWQIRGRGEEIREDVVEALNSWLEALPGSNE